MNIDSALLVMTGERENRRRFPVRIQLGRRIAMLGRDAFADALIAEIDRAKVGRGCEVVSGPEMFDATVSAVFYPPRWKGEAWSADRQRVWDGIQLLHEADERKRRLSKERLARRTHARATPTPRTLLRYA